ncbi:putative G-protein coupled receptor 64 [Rosellinia necatrix]|uniref:Putative G-protein coupled receptor 64 n=1 Tax=Rosellinia necatrix TaxID=77044 RepID=A0A1S7UMR9_ROSNE|nr:putative G-protein coupled receptor 64 [Rosellinia necatrix]
MEYIRLLTPSIYPITHLFLSFLVFHSALHTSSYRRRLLLLPFFLLFAIFSFRQSTRLRFSPTAASIWAQSVALNIVHVLSLFLIEKWPTPGRSRAVGSWYSSLGASYRLWSNPRLIPAAKASSAGAKQESLVTFLILRIPKLLLYYYAARHAQPWLLKATIVALRAEDVAETALFTRLSDLTLREAAVRSHIAVAWAWDNFVMMDGLHTALATVMVVSGFDQPEDWPRLFGGLPNTCGLRNFWSRFWHRLARRPYTNCGHAVSRGMGSVGLPRPSILSDTVVAFMVFLISGLSHAAVSRQMGWKDWLDVKWFLLNFVACLVENMVLRVARQVAVKIGRQRELVACETSWLGWLLGFSWVFGFFFWSVPLWQFPRLHTELVKAGRWSAIMSHLESLNVK